jgi:hypothetical protein
MRYDSRFLKDKIMVKLSIMIAIEVLLVASSFGIRRIFNPNQQL